MTGNLYFYLKSTDFRIIMVHYEKRGKNDDNSRIESDF